MIKTTPFYRVLIFLVMVVLCQVTLWPVYSLSSESGDPIKNISVASPNDIDERLLRSLKQSSPAGWRLRKPVKLFDNKNLWEIIDGHADFFLSYDMVRMTFADYRDSSDPERFIFVFIYDMGNPTNAFGVFSGERQEETNPIDLGRQAYRFGENLFIWKGHYYLHMIASKNSPELQKINLLTAKKLVDSLDDSGESVRGLERLPKKDRVPGSEQYYRKDAMGLDFLDDTFMARYRKNTIIFTFFLSYKENPAAAGDLLERYVTYAKEFGEGTREVIRSGVTITLCDMDGAYDALFLKDGMVAGVTSIEDPELAVDLAFEFRRRLPAVSGGILNE
ncbi:DUF6599 family protein [Thermodesulfobacteriota bacterium]